MDQEILIRFKSFGYELLTTLILGVATFLSSSDFSTLVTDNFGATITGTLLLFVSSAVVKTIRNRTVKKKVGGEGGSFDLI